MTYEQGREMAKHAEITQRVGWPFIFVTHTAPLNGSNENINGLIRQFLSKGLTARGNWMKSPTYGIFVRVNASTGSARLK